MDAKSWFSLRNGQAGQRSKWSDRMCPVYRPIIHTFKNTLTNKLYATVYTGGFIDEDLKVQQYKRLKRSNRVGGDAGTNLNFAFKFKNKKSGFPFLI